MTRQRRVILDELRSGGGHPIADALYERVRRTLPKISLGTVYRNLELLCEAGMIRRLPVGDGPRRFDGDVRRHYHVRCVRCGRIRDIPAEPFGALDAAAGGVCDYEVLDHSLEFQGLCGECRGNHRGSEGSGRASPAMTNDEARMTNQ